MVKHPQARKEALPAFKTNLSIFACHNGQPIIDVTVGASRRYNADQKYALALEAKGINVIITGEDHE